MATTRICVGRIKGHVVQFHPSANLKPTSQQVRLAVFSMIKEEIKTSVSILDLYAGTGILGIEALSLGCASADFVEINRKTARQLNSILKSFNLDSNTQVYPMSTESFLSLKNKSYDIIFIDPPYKTNPWPNLFSKILSTKILKENGIIVAEHYKKQMLPSVEPQLRKLNFKQYGDTSISILKKIGNN